MRGEVGHQPVGRARSLRSISTAARIAKLGSQRVEPVLAPGNQHQLLPLADSWRAKSTPSPADAPVISATGLVT